MIILTVTSANLSAVVNKNQIFIKISFFLIKYYIRTYVKVHTFIFFGRFFNFLEILGFAPNLEKEFQGMSSETLTSDFGIALSISVGKTRY